ncbi:MAG: glycosidase [Lachnospiraceae bacterium]|nr:glycosidase [Lachnospiraceae bacterium]
MAWYDSAVFYHIYPLGLCGCPHDNHGEQGSHFNKITEWSDHAQRIGCTAIYIGPLFKSGSHGYDTIDYRTVDNRLGTNEDFKAYVKHCHKIGMKVIVDGVFNHTGRGFFAFEDLMRNREHSRYRDWYCNVNFWGNNEYNDGFSYDNWGGHNLLVKLNMWNQEVKNYLFDTVRFWITEFDIDGIRLDAADVLDFGFMRDLRGVCDAMKPDFWLMGEVIHGDYSRWANAGMLHSVTNYELHKGLFSGHNDHNYFEIAHSVKRLLGIVGDKIRLYTFVDNHDVARIYSKLNNKAHLANVTMLLYTLPGIPSVYYGSEFGVEGNKEWGSDWNLRPCLELSDFDENADLPKLHKALGRLKAQFPALTWGEYKELSLTTQQYAFARTLDGKSVVTALNNGDNAAHLEIPLPVNANHAVNLLTLPDETEADNDAAAALRAEHLKEAKAELTVMADELYESAGAVRDASREVKKAVKKIKVTGDALKEQMGDSLAEMRAAMNELQKVYDAFAEKCGAQTEMQSAGSMEGCQTLEIRDGRLIVDLLPNSGVVALVDWQ